MIAPSFANLLATRPPAPRRTVWAISDPRLPPPGEYPTELDLPSGERVTRITITPEGPRYVSFSRSESLSGDERGTRYETVSRLSDDSTWIDRYAARSIPAEALADPAAWLAAAEAERVAWDGWRVRLARVARDVAFRAYEKDGMDAYMAANSFSRAVETKPPHQSDWDRIPAQWRSAIIAALAQEGGAS